MSKEMRKLIDSYAEFIEKQRKVDVIITYDIMTIQKEFRASVLKYLGSGPTGGISEITESTYKISNKLTGAEIESMINDIQLLHEEALKLLEGKVSKGTRVKLILPLENTLNVIPVIEYNP